jgi:hypothetical protein
MRWFRVGRSAGSWGATQGRTDLWSGEGGAYRRRNARSSPRIPRWQVFVAGLVLGAVGGYMAHGIPAVAAAVRRVQVWVTVIYHQLLPLMP